MTRGVQQTARYCPKCWAEGLSPTVQRAEDIRQGREVAKPGKFDFPTIESDDSAGWLQGYMEALEGRDASEKSLAESMVMIRDVAMDTLLRSETLADDLEPTPLTACHDNANAIHEALAEIIRLLGEAIEPYIREPDAGG